MQKIQCDGDLARYGADDANISHETYDLKSGQEIMNMYFPGRVHLTDYQQKMLTIIDQMRRRKTLIKSKTSLTLQIKSKARGYAFIRVRNTKTTNSEINPKEIIVTKYDMMMAVRDTSTLMEARMVINNAITEIERDVKPRIRTLPIWQKWGKDVKGLGELSLGSIISCCENPGAYKNVGYLWKRFGLGFILDNEKMPIRQRLCRDKDMAVKMGYSPERRSTMHVIGDCLIRARGLYKEIYDFEKEKLEEKHPELTKIHKHRRAMRKMEKIFLRDFRRAWRQTMPQ